MTPGQAAELRGIAERQPREHQRGGEQEAHAATRKRWQRLDGDRDAEVGRAPDQVDAAVRERDARFQRGSAHGRNLPRTLATVQIQV